MGLVNKEFYEISRDNNMWKKKIEQNFPFLVSNNYEDIGLKEKYGPFILFTPEIKEHYDKDRYIKIHSLKELSLSEYIPFCQYWNLINELYEIKYREDMPMMMSTLFIIFYFYHFVVFIFN
jgi:hypothetical protein